MALFSIFGYYGQGNAGDEAILAALVDGIKTTVPEAQISVYSANPDETRKTHQVDAYRPFSLDLKLIIKGILGRSRIHYLKSVFNFLRSDVIVIGGGGLFFDSKETNKWIHGYLKLIHRAKQLGKKVALVGISVGPLHHKDSELAIGQAFSSADLISVRDNNSKELLIKCGIMAEKIHIIPDLVFTLQSISDERIQQILEQEKFISNGKANIALTPCCYNTAQPGWLMQYIAFCERATSELDSNLWLVPMQRHNIHDDLSVIHDIYTELSEPTRQRTSILKNYYTAKEVQGVLSKANFVLAERLHGSIMALNTGTPFMGIAYMPKVVGVLELAGLQENIINFYAFLSGESMQMMIATAGNAIKDKNNNRATDNKKFNSATVNFIKLADLLKPK